MMVNIFDKDFTMTTSYTKIEQLFESRKNNPQYNTSYPLSPDDWVRYSTSGELPFDISEPIAFYLHIPFCRQICSFCEYTKICVPPSGMQQKYLHTLASDIQKFTQIYPDLTLYGVDIGGGTPTALDDDNFSHLMSIYSDCIGALNKTPDFEPSIEATFQTLSDTKIDLIAKKGINRLSLGIQSTSENVLEPLHRQSVSIDKMKSIIRQIHDSGISKVNLDLMYGLPGQNTDTIKQDLAVIKKISPEQVTLYEFRTNQLNNRFNIKPEICFCFYCHLYEGLTALGYYGVFGQNTFSRDNQDKGLSSYLRHRMFDGWQYKGFGISAQSMSKIGLSYNKGKNTLGIKQLIGHSYSYETTDYYNLPAREMFGKYIAISGYSGGFYIDVAKRILGAQFAMRFNPVLKYLQVSCTEKS